MQVSQELELPNEEPVIAKKTPVQRRVRYNPKSRPKGLAGLLVRIKTDSQFLRESVQIFFLVITLVIGFQFFLFVSWLQSDGKLWFVSRPPGVEAFLPIGAFISLKYWWKTGIINEIHPAGLFLLIAFLVISWLLKKAFCSWICPVGWLSEKLWHWGEKIFGKNFKMWNWLDKGLRSLKYILMGFFLWVIFFMMDTNVLHDFIYGAYNKITDIKMLFFFTHMTLTTAIVLFILVVLSMLYKNFWCRYLCPYGAVLGFISKASPVKITRNVNTCIDCELCTKACPSLIKVHKLNKISSDECTACLSCLEVCPVKDTLDLRTSPGNKRIPVPVFASMVVGIFLAVVGFAMLTGHWQNKISNQEYFSHIHQIDGPQYRHF